MVSFVGFVKRWLTDADTTDPLTSTSTSVRSSGSSVRFSPLARYSAPPARAIRGVMTTSRQTATTTIAWIALRMATPPYAGQRSDRGGPYSRARVIFRRRRAAAQTARITSERSTEAGDSETLHD